jgi:hypothetical protein
MQLRTGSQLRLAGPARQPATPLLTLCAGAGAMCAPPPLAYVVSNPAECAARQTGAAAGSTAVVLRYGQLCADHQSRMTPQRSMMAPALLLARLQLETGSAVATREARVTATRAVRPRPGRCAATALRLTGSLTCKPQPLSDSPLHSSPPLTLAATISAGSCVFAGRRPQSSHPWRTL